MQKRKPEPVATSTTPKRTEALALVDLVVDGRLVRCGEVFEADFDDIARLVRARQADTNPAAVASGKAKTP